MAVSLFIQITLKPGVRETFLELATAHQRRVRDREPTCQQFDILEQEGDDEHVCLYEVYDDQAAFDLHVNTEYMKAYLEETKDMTTGRLRYFSTIRE
jgi:quinol monooxygenase YgiN